MHLACVRAVELDTCARPKAGDGSGIMSTAKRAILVTQWFPPEPVQQPFWIAKAMQRSGFITEVLTGVPNYPTGQVMTGHRAIEVATEAIQGLTVHRTPLFPSHDASAAGRILNYVSWMTSAATAGLRHFRRADVSLVYSSPATAAFPAMVARRLLRVPYVLLIQDVWPDSIFSSGFLTGPLRKPVEWLLHRYVERTYRRASHIAVISPGMANLLQTRGVPATKLTVVYNWVGESDDRPHPPGALRAQLGLSEDDFLIMYAGNHGAAQALDAVLEGIAIVPESEHCHLVLVGGGVEKPRLQRIAERVAPERVHFLDPQPRDVVRQLTADADAQLVALADKPLFSVTIPSKLQAVMSEGCPILAVASGDVTRIVDEARAGLCASPGKPMEIADAVTKLRRMDRAELRAMGSRAREHYARVMAEEVGMQQMAEILVNAAEGGR